MTSLLALFVAVPLLASGGLLALGRHRVFQAVVLLATSLASTIGGVVLVVIVHGAGPIAHGIGQWPYGVSIPFAVDMFAALMLAATGLLVFVCSIFAISYGAFEGRYFAPMALGLMAGVSGALLTADLFNLFVFIEVMLLPAYALSVLSKPDKGSLKQVTATRLYVTLSLLTSAIFLTGVAFIYGTAGTVNLGELRGAASESEPVAIATGICLLALMIKAGIVPMHAWIAQTYPTGSPAVTALFSGMHTKVAIYAIYRIYSQMFDGDDRFQTFAIVLFSVTMVVGVFAAAGETTTRRILSFHMVSQIGYIMVGVALFTESGIAAAIFYQIHHMFVKAALFLTTGAIEVTYGSGELAKLGGMAKREPLVAVAFMIAALSMAGLPPFSGFIAKLALVLASIEVGQIALVVVMLVVSLITLLSMLKIWNGVFWGTYPGADTSGRVLLGQNADARDADESPGGHELIPTTPTTVTAVPVAHRVKFWVAAPGVILAVVTIVLGIGAEGLLDLTSIAATQLLDTQAYTEAVAGS